MSICIERHNIKNTLGCIQDNVSENASVSKNIFIDKNTLELTITGFSKWNVFEQMKVWNSRIRQRKHLSTLDERLLADIGYTVEEVRQESSKPFWN